MDKKKYDMDKTYFMKMYSSSGRGKKSSMENERSCSRTEDEAQI